MNARAIGDVIIPVLCMSLFAVSVLILLRCC